MTLARLLTSAPSGVACALGITRFVISEGGRSARRLQPSIVVARWRVVRSNLSVFRLSVGRCRPDEVQVIK